MNKPRSGDSAHRQLANSFLRVLRQGDEEAVSRVLEAALAQGIDGPTIYLKGLQPALEQIGQLWETGRVLVAEEHRATVLARWVMDTLWDDFISDSYRGDNDHLLAGGVRGERHDLGLIMVARFLRRDGWHVFEMGTDVPEQDFASIAARIHPRVCLLSAALPQRLEAVRTTIAGLRDSGFTAPIMVGGRVFRLDPGLVSAVGASGTAADAAEAVTRVHQLLGL